MYAVLVILVATGLSSTVGFRRIGNLIAGQVGGSGDAMQAHNRMSVALDEQMQSLLVLLERPLTSIEREALGRTIDTFDRELDAAAQQPRATEFGLDAVRRAWIAHRAHVRQLLAEGTPPPPAELAAALATLGDLRRATTSFVLRRKLDASELRDLIRITARRYVLLAVGLTSLGMVIALLFHFRFSHYVQRPIEQVAAFFRAWGTADSVVGERLSVQGDETVAELVRVCNEHFETIERRGEEHWRELRNEQRIATGLMEMIDGPAVLLNPAGEPLRANEAARQVLISEQGPEVRKEMRRVVVENLPVTETSHVLSARPVAAPGEFSGTLLQLHPLATEPPPAS